jgi:hypothetical protein
MVSFVLVCYQYEKKKESIVGRDYGEHCGGGGCGGGIGG